jgi:hypothetical protein
VRRVLAVVAAVVLIALGLVIRSRTGDGGTTRADTGAASLVCLTELKPVCDRLAAAHPELTVTVQDAATTQTALGGNLPDVATGPNAWLTYAPLTAMVDESRARAGLPGAFADPTATLARSPLVIAARNDRRAALTTACGGQLTWRCLGERAGSPWTDNGGQATWGSVKVGLPDPAVTATGLLGVAEATASYFGRTDYAANDFADPAFGDWLGRLARSGRGLGRTTSTPLDQLLTQRGSYDFAGTTESAGGPAVSQSRDKNEVSILYPSPLSTADVVLAPVAGSSTAGDRVKKLLESDEAAQALADAGWRVEGRASAPGVPGDPPLDGAGLPRPGVLAALREQWTQVAR